MEEKNQRTSKPNKMRVMLTGASGLLGRQVYRQLQNDEWEVRGLCGSRQRGGLISCDLTRKADIEAQLSDFRPDIVIHMAAERRPDVCHKNADGSHRINVDATSSIARACHKAGAWLIYVSTDYVFDGTSPPYTTDATPKPLSEYGQQKLEGELATLQECPSAAVLRVPLMYGPIEHFNESGVTCLLPDLRSGEMKSADHWQKRYPTYTKDVARVVARMIEAHREGERLTGTFHWQADECLTKFDMVQLIASLSDHDASGVAPKADPPAYPTPKDSKLDCCRLINALGIDPADFRTPIREALGDCFAKERQAGMVKAIAESASATTSSNPAAAAALAAAAAAAAATAQPSASRNAFVASRLAAVAKKAAAAGSATATGLTKAAAIISVEAVQG
jgi:S-adenosylmethionine synthetase